MSHLHAQFPQFKGRTLLAILVQLNPPLDVLEIVKSQKVDIPENGEVLMTIAPSAENQAYRLVVVPKTRSIPDRLVQIPDQNMIEWEDLVDVNPSTLEPYASGGDVDISHLVPDTRTVAGKPLTDDVELTKTDVGLGSVDDTSDEDKPVSTAQATALASKANSTHTHAIGDVTNLQTELDEKLTVAAPPSSGTYTLQSEDGVLSWIEVGE